MQLVVAVVLGILVFSLVSAAIVILLAQLMARSVQRANRISPRVPTQAPALWRWSMGVAARDHRRLQRVAALARASAAVSGVGGVGVGDLANDLERQACALDDQLALARHLPTSQRVRRLFDLERAIGELEKLALRVTALAGQMSSGTAETTVPLEERITHLEQAMAEVRRIEAEALGEARALGQGVFYPPIPRQPEREPEPVRRRDDG